MNQADVKCFLTATGWLSTLPPPLKNALAQRARCKTLAQGQSLYHVGDPAGGPFGLATGSLAVTTFPGPRSQHKSFILHPGAWMGEGTTSGLPERTVGITATRASTVMIVDRSTFHEIANRHPELWRYLIMLALENTHRAVRLADALMERDSRKRVAMVLLQLGGQYDPYCRSEVTIDLTQSELASIVNLSRSALSPILRALHRAEILSLGRTEITVHQPAGLHDMMR